MVTRIAKPQKPPSIVVDQGARSFRAAQVRGVDGDAVTLKLFLEANIIGERVTTRAAFEGHLPSVGNPVYCEVNPSQDYAIVAVFPTAPADHGLERAWERDGFTFSYGRIQQQHGGNK